jgi:CTP-dependent riboflavin kinase
LCSENPAETLKSTLSIPPQRGFLNIYFNNKKRPRNLAAEKNLIIKAPYFNNLKYGSFYAEACNTPGFHGYSL